MSGFDEDDIHLLSSEIRDNDAKEISEKVEKERVRQEWITSSWDEFFDASFGFMKAWIDKEKLDSSATRIQLSDADKEYNSRRKKLSSKKTII